MALELVTAGESHGRELVTVLSGVPAGLRVDRAAIDAELARRQHGHGRSGRQKIEHDRVDVRGGLRGGVTLGSPRRKGCDGWTASALSRSQGRNQNFGFSHCRQEKSTMNIPELFIRRPVMTTLVMMGILLFGILSSPLMVLRR